MEAAKKFVPEINIIRDGCLAVIIMHSIDSNNYSHLLPELEN